MTERRVLVVGWRAGIGRALESLGIPFAIWHRAPLKNPPAGVHIEVAPFPSTSKTVRDHAQPFVERGPFTHVIAGTEDAVVTASYARRELGARRSKHTTVRRCHDKLFMKDALTKHGVPMTPYVDGNTVRAPSDVIDVLGAPVVVKDRTASGGRGMELVHTSEEAAHSPLKRRIAERFVDAPEVSIESFVARGEVRFENVTEYLQKKHVNGVPAALPEPLRTRCLELSRRVIAALRIEWGITHLEVYLTSEGPLFGEVALRPPGGYIMEAMGLAYDFDAWMAFVSVELDLEFAFPTEAPYRAAAVVLHPGAGTVTAIHGEAEVAADPNVKRLRLKVAPGDAIDPRAGVGADVGYALIRAPDRLALLESIGRTQKTLVFEMARGQDDRARG